MEKRQLSPGNFFLSGQDDTFDPRDFFAQCFGHWGSIVPLHVQLNDPFVFIRADLNVRVSDCKFALFTQPIL